MHCKRSDRRRANTALGPPATGRGEEGRQATRKAPALCPLSTTLGGFVAIGASGGIPRGDCRETGGPPPTSRHSIAGSADCCRETGGPPPACRQRGADSSPL